ncbi:hypothetical protein E4T48_08527 [Aureobasidium sp. EXF-10727]|nr:hypothetical protein E4T48_08527 [Aureobasidium sp. EXF-10727]
MSRPTPVRRKFEELHPRDRNVKTNRKTRIEANWGCSVQECIPMKIRPRVELKKGAKIRIGDAAGAEEIWWNWSVELLRGLEELSTMMSSKRTVAQELLVHEVQKRQGDDKNPQRRVAELLLGDVQRVVDNVKRHQAGKAAKGIQQQDVDMMTFQELEREPGPGVKKQGQQAQDETPEYTDDGFSPGDMPSPTPASAYMHNGTHQANGITNTNPINLFNNPVRSVGAHMPKSTEQLNESLQVDAMEMRARAKRLRGQAMRLEAEAFDLESEAAIARKVLNNS